MGDPWRPWKGGGAGFLFLTTRLYMNVYILHTHTHTHYAYIHIYIAWSRNIEYLERNEEKNAKRRNDEEGACGYAKGTRTVGWQWAKASHTIRGRCVLRKPCLRVLFIVVVVVFTPINRSSLSFSFSLPLLRILTRYCSIIPASCGRLCLEFTHPRKTQTLLN